MTGRLGPLVMVALVAGLLMGAVATGAAAAESDSRLTVTVQEPAKAGLGYRIRAQLQADGPVNGATIRFFVMTDLYGAAFLGSGQTDATGTAFVPIEPRQAVLRIRASFAGTDAVDGAEIVEALTFPPDAVVAVATIHRAHGLLAPVRGAMPVVISTLVALVWMTLAGTVLWVLLSGRGAVRETAGDRQRASAQRPLNEEPMRQESQ